jgi:hypothetical protein
MFSTDGKSYDVEKLWDLTHSNVVVPVQHIPLDKLKHVLHDPVWETASDVGLCPRDVLADARRYPDHARRIEEAALSFPILVGANDNGGFYIIDGVHRLCKALRNNRKTIKAKVVPPFVLEMARMKI